MKVLDAGTQMLDDYAVLQYIRQKREQHQAEDKAAKAEGRKNHRPPNFVRALKKHEDHLADPNRPFVQLSDPSDAASKVVPNPKYDEEQKYLFKLMHTLSPHVDLTRIEYLVLVNQRPYRRKQMSAMIEDCDTRFTVEQQNLIRDTIVEVLGIKDGVETNKDAGEVDIKQG